MDINNSNTKSSQRVKEMVQIALMTAITYLSAMFIQIPYGNGGVVHLGDSMIFVTALLLGTRQAVIAGAVGMTMFDLFSPYAYYAPYTFIIKAVMALIVGLIANSGGAKGKNMIRNIIGIVVAGAWGVVGYFIAETIMYSSVLIPIPNLLGNVIQAAAGGSIGVILFTALKNTKYFNK